MGSASIPTPIVHTKDAVYIDTIPEPVITVTPWAANYLKKRTKANMRATIQIYNHAQAVYNIGTKVITYPQGTLLYEGIARIWAGDSGQMALLGEQLVNFGTVNISVPQDVTPTPHRDDIIMVLANPDDTGVVGKNFRIISVDYGGLMAPTTKFTCQIMTDTWAWEPAI